MKFTPVLLLTGYLGSGKTTLVNNILKNTAGIRFAVIVNDIGEVNIDASLIQKGGVVAEADQSLVALQNGCICCSLQMDLVEQLRGIMAAGKFDYIVIEASGICEPEPIARTICSFPTMGPEVCAHGIPRIDAIVTVVDALRLADEFDNVVSLSARSGEGVSVLCDAIGAMYPAGEGRPGELLTNARQADAVARALASVRSAK